MVLGNLARQLRRLAYLCIGFALAANAVLAFADSPGTETSVWVAYSRNFRTALAACQSVVGSGGQVSGNTCYNFQWQPVLVMTESTICVSSWSGDEAATWGPLPCIPANPCQAKASEPATYGWYTRGTTQDISGPNYCSDGCRVSLSLDSGTPDYFYTAEKVTQRYSRSFTGEQCSGQPAAPSPAPAGKEPPVPPKKPPCGSDEGVLTSSSGKVSCVPPGTPSANPPEVNKTKRTDGYPDGSTKVTETTSTVDPSTRAVDINITVTATPATGGGAGQAGTPGTATSTKELQPNPVPGVTGSPGSTTATPTKDNGDFCAQNPNLQICKGDMATEATAKRIADALDTSASDPTTIADMGPKDATQQQYLDENEKNRKAVTGEIDPASDKRSAWQQAMESGWFDPIPSSSCTPFAGSFGDKSVTIDHCPVADKVSKISEYALWFMIAWGVFVMFTGGKKES